MTRQFFVLCLLVLAFGSAVMAQGLDLATAKQEGLIGERPDGLVGAVSDSVDPGLLALIGEINAAREAQYRQIAEEAGAPVAAVKARAGQSLIARTPAGQFIMTPDGQWQRKAE